MISHVILGVEIRKQRGVLVLRCCWHLLLLHTSEKKRIFVSPQMGRQMGRRLARIPRKVSRLLRHHWSSCAAGCTLAPPHTSDTGCRGKKAPQKESWKGKNEKRSLRFQVYQLQRVDSYNSVLCWNVPLRLLWGGALLQLAVKIKKRGKNAKSILSDCLQDNRCYCKCKLDVTHRHTPLVKRFCPLAFNQRPATRWPSESVGRRPSTTPQDSLF